VSGAGPTLLAIVPEGIEEAVGRAVVAAYKRDATPTRLQVAGVDAQGARLE
jgi:homoserine kinase